jgi:ER membrane protein complex subunit 8/9
MMAEGRDVTRDRMADTRVSYTLADQAYLKIFFHAAKYPHRPANGVLVGTLSSTNSVLIQDAIPLLHHWTSLSPMMEIGLDLVSPF